MINSTGYKPNYSEEIEIDKYNVVTFFVQPMMDDLAKQYFKDTEVYIINACWHNLTQTLVEYEYVAFIEQADFFRWLNTIKNESKENDKEQIRELR
jgi:hypothetical protein